MGPDNSVWAIAFYNDELIAGGPFLTAGGNESHYFARYGPKCLRGDLNCDQTVNEFDAPLFADALLAAPYLSTCDAYTANLNADVNPDGTPRVDGEDIAPFVTCLLAGPCP
jgi:hypothetical protein